MNYCGRYFSDSEINMICRLIAENPRANRIKLSGMVCELLRWRRPDGQLKQMSCRVAMIRMHNDGIIQLPPPKNKNGNGTRTPRRTVCCDPPPLLFTTPAGRITNLKIEIVANKNQSYLWNEFIDRYHYLGYTPLPGAQLRYFVKSQNTVLALFGFGASAWMTAPRDRFIGWDHDHRQKNLHLVINNARFLILPWVQSVHLASFLLSRVSRQIAEDWQIRYNYRPVLLETFVETPRFKGTAYKSANWILVGQTQGRGKLGQPGQGNLPKKDIWLYPLSKHFRQILCN